MVEMSWFDWFLLGLYDMYKFLEECLVIPLIIFCIIFGLIAMAIVIAMNKKEETTISETVERTVKEEGWNFGAGGEE